MTNHRDDDRDEEPLAFLLSQTARDAALPDRAFLDRLRDQSTEAFQTAFSEQVPRRRRFMFFGSARILVATAAAAAIVVGLYFGFTPWRSEPTLGEALDRLATAKTLYLSVHVQGKTKVVWVRQPGQMRLENEDGTYEIIRDGKVWLVDEKNNRVIPQASSSAPGDAEPGIDIWALLQFPAAADRQNLMNARPIARTEHGGRTLNEYRAFLPCKGAEYYSPLVVEATVDALTGELTVFNARPAGKGGPDYLANLNVLALNAPIAEEKFIVGDTLTEDGRVGKVNDVQGTVSLKPVAHERWTPVRKQMLLKPGDWVRTDIRGANATALRLVKQTDVILGPGTLVEVIKPTQLRLFDGFIEVSVPAKTTVELLGPNGQKVAVQGTQRFHIDKERLVAVVGEPVWLKGFKGTTANESIGSLVAKVDGRNVPLTVGYHKVSVDIRDQIARTTIEESFVNRTDAVLEGVFYFPLPQDASISGFGMWIGDRLVEADVVEKQRAREIYDEILRERRDPGLLEWSGGNLFTARVYPIPASSEKRIKITYTQVLPLKGSRYRYSYALQSEMLQLHPLRELALDVRISSAVPLKSVTSPTHPARIEQTAHAGHVEFTAQEYTPSRDFEAVIEVDGRGSDVVVIPHRRGDDGSFMLELTPPAAGGDWERDVLADGEPVRLLILADTSASIDARQRATQNAFLAALLSGLTPKDTINVAACDVECDWVFEKPMPAEPKNTLAVREFLGRRSSLGWTDLDKAFASALARSGPHTHIVYLGDGISTTGDADPQAFAKRLKRLYEGKTGTCHAVALGSLFESSVLKTIATLGGGSVRRISGEQGPQAVALELLKEIAQPSLHDIKLEFRGVQTARVYPEVLPNIPPGSQQIILGRYLPQGHDQAGEVVVTGTLGNKPVRYSAHLALKDAEQGNSFIPRLWARMHLDYLLDQGSSPAIKDEIIALSEEYQIITPYTSFLVLESDADRERFKVKQTFRMRDGEKFFAEGRENANYELVQQQMRRAGTWRLGLRRQVLAWLERLGRDLPLYPRPQRGADDVLGVTRLGSVPVTESATRFEGKGESKDALSEDVLESRAGDGPYAAEDAVSSARETPDLGDKADLKGKKAKLSANGPAEPDDSLDGREGELGLQALGNKPGLLNDFEEDVGRAKDRKGAWRPGGRGGFMGESEAYGYFGRRGLPPWPGPDEHWLSGLFPMLPAAPGKPTDPKSTWPEPARALARSLLRRPQLAQLTGGLEIQRTTEAFDPRWAELTAHSRRRELYSRALWLIRAEGDAAQTLINWCDARERGVLSLAFLLGRIRSASERDLAAPPLELPDYSLTPLDQAYPEYLASVEPSGPDQALLVLKHPSSPTYETRVVVDTSRHVVRSVEQREHGKVVSTVKFENFVNVAGGWWATHIETTDGQGRLTARITQTIKSIDTAALTAEVNKELATRKQVQFLHQPLLTVKEAKRALTSLGELTFDVPFALLLHYARSQQWTRVMEQLEQCERLSVGKPGMHWLREAVLLLSRRHEELKQRQFAEADRLAKTPAGVGQDELFLADYLLSQAAGFLQANETLAMLDHLRPLYQRQPARLERMKLWQRQRVTYLQNAGQSDEARRILKQLATDYPRDEPIQEQYAQALAAVGEYDAAYAWLNQALARNPKWLPYEEDALRSKYADLMEGQGRFAELATYLAPWVQRDPERTSADARYLSALIRSNQVNKANALVTQWLKEGQVKGEASPAVASHVYAAVMLALGQGHNLYTNRMEERWLLPLSEAALYFARHNTQLSLANTIMQHGQVQQSHEGRHVRQVVGSLLANDLDKLSVEQISQFINWVWNYPDAVDAATWKKIAAGLRTLWTAQTQPMRKHQLGQSVVQVMTGKVGVNELLAFLRVQWHEGPEAYRDSYAEQLFSTLLAQPYAAAHEDEAFAMLEKLSTALEPAERLRVAVSGLYRLTDRMIAARAEARNQTIEHPEKLTRKELQQKHSENLRLARTEYADRLRREAGKHGPALQPWLTVERLYVDTLLDRNLKAVAAECWELLGPQPPKPQKATGEQDAAARLTEVLHDRCLLTLANLAARKNADPALADRLLKYLDQGIAGDLEDEHFALLKYQVLVALDRPKELEQALQTWIRAGDADNRWRLTLGYLLAEQGKIDAAVGLFEGIQASDELGPMAYRALADWYMVQNRRELHDRALVNVYKTAEEWRLYRILYGKMQPWQRGDGHVPTELDKEVLQIFAALFEKSGAPQNYLWLLQTFYQYTRNFELLAGLADAVIGHSTGEVYPFLQSMGGVLGEIQDEATADSLVERIHKVRARGKTVVDARALDLLEALVERRAAELKNQPGPHGRLALTALQRAFKRTWSAGEPRLMADFLAGLGRIALAELAQEQLRELESLHHDGVQGSLDRLRMGHRLAQTLAAYGRTAAAIDLLQPALQEYQEANGGVLPVSANEPLDTLVSYQENLGHYVKGESILLAQLGHAIHRQQTYWLEERLYRLYHSALAAGAEVNLGKEQVLYTALERKLRAGMATDDQNHRYSLLGYLCGVYRTAHGRRLDGVGEDLRAFAFKQLPQVLERQTNQYDSMVGTVAGTVHDLLGPRDGIAFLLNQIDQEPAWFRLNNQDAWSRHAWTIGQWRAEVKDLGDLEKRLLTFVVAELRRDLESRQQRSRVIYHQQNTYYWSEKADDFAKTAEAVLAAHSGFGPEVQYIADYFYWGLGRAPRAIEILFAAHKQKVLDESGESQLVQYLRWQNRYAETIALLQSLVQRQPENMQYRVWLMNGYFHTQQPAELLALLKQTDTLFHQQGRWTEQAMASLAQSTLENALFTQSAAYFNEVIPLHQRTQPNQGIGNGTLSSYYSGLAQAYTGLHKTREAVEAASGAIVSWGPTHQNRATALEALKQVLRQADDLDAYVAWLDKENPRQIPIVRKAIGQVYVEKKEYARAVAQLQIAAELQPNDMETYQALVAAYDSQGDKEGAIQTLLRATELNRRDIKLYQELGRRLAALQRPREVERAFTSIVEVLPHEFESHTLLAEIRESENRWPDAITQWEQVARLRALEPTGLLKLASAQIHEGRWDAARQSLHGLQSRSWPSRFGDVQGQVRQLEQQIDKARSP